MNGVFMKWQKLMTVLWVLALLGAQTNLHELLHGDDEKVHAYCQVHKKIEHQDKSTVDAKPKKSQFAQLAFTTDGTDQSSGLHEECLALNVNPNPVSEKNDHHLVVKLICSSPLAISFNAEVYRSAKLYRYSPSISPPSQA